MLKIIKNLSENYLNFLMQSFQKQSSSVLNNIGKCSMQGGGYKKDVIVLKHHWNMFFAGGLQE